MRKEIQVSVSVGWLPINISDSNTISSGDQGVQEGNLTIVFKFNSERNFGIGDIKGIVKGRDSILLDNHETVIESRITKRTYTKEKHWKSTTSEPRYKLTATHRLLFLPFSIGSHPHLQFPRRKNWFLCFSNGLSHLILVRVLHVSPTSAVQLSLSRDYFVIMKSVLLTSH